MKDRVDEKCKSCKYDGTDEGGYFCLCCILIGEFTPHIGKENKKE